MTNSSEQTQSRVACSLHELAEGLQSASHYIEAARRVKLASTTEYHRDPELLAKAQAQLARATKAYLDLRADLDRRNLHCDTD